MSNLEKLEFDLAAVRQKKRDLEFEEAVLMLLICHEENPEKAQRVAMAVNTLFPVGA